MFDYKKLISDTFIFALGNLGSKVITFLLVPFYTYYLSTSDYGIIDIANTAINLLLPLVTLSVYESVLRLTMDKNANKKSIFTNCFMISIIGIIIFCIIITLSLNYIENNKSLIIFTSAIISTNVIQILLAQFSRAIGAIKVYSWNGIISTLVIAVCNIIFLKYFNMGINGYFYAMIIGGIISIIYLVAAIKPIKYIDFRYISLQKIKDALGYSMPLMPNSISLWISNAANRFFILYFLGANANGLFAVAYKIPSILSILYSIFYQAWQLSAINQFESKNNSYVYSDVFKKFSTLMFLGASAIIMVIRPFMKIFVSESYYEAWNLIPFLLLGTVFLSFSSFLGTTYIAAKKTKGVVLTTVYSAILSLILNIVLIPSIGLNGAGVSMMISYFLLWYIRVIDTKKFVEISIEKNVYFNILIILVQSIVINLIENELYSQLTQIVCFLLICLINKSLLMKLKNIMLYYIKLKLH